MSNQPIPAPMPLPGDHAHDGEHADAGLDATREVDGKEVLDPDANDDLVDSATADVIASGADDRDI